MKQKTFRRLRRLLYLFMAVVFVLLYLLMRQGEVGPDTGEGWTEGKPRELGTVYLSSVRSGGFILDQMPLEQITTPSDPDFADHLAVCHATVVNEGGVPARVLLDVYGTNFKDGTTPNPGLFTACYLYSGAEDPFAADRQSFLAQCTPTQRSMTLYLQSGASEWILQPGEQRTLSLFLWVGDDWDPAFPYSVTVTLLAREAAST